MQISQDKPEELGNDSAPTSPWERGDFSDPPCVIHPEQAPRPGRIVTPQGDLLFLNLRGSFASMAGQTGLRLRDEIQQGPLPFFARYLDTLLKRRTRLTRLSGAVDLFTRHWVTRRLAQNLPAEYRAAAVALANASGMSLDDLLSGYLMHESFLWVLDKYPGLRSPRFIDTPTDPESAPYLGNTTAIVRPPASESILHGHNVDYFGIDYWDRRATVTFYHPDEGMDYVSVGSAGIIGGGLTAMNAAGLTLTVHQHHCDALDLDGVPVGFAGDMAMRQAHTIEEAVAILRNHPPVAGWTYVLCEGDTGRGAIYRVSPEKEDLEIIADSRSTFSAAHPDITQDIGEAPADQPVWQRSLRNQPRVDAFLEERFGPGAAPGGPRDIATILGDFKDPHSGRERLFGNTIAGPNTVASVVFEPKHRRVWVAAGASPSSRNWYIPFSLTAIDAHTGGPDPSAQPFIVDRGWHPSAHGQAFELYRKACVRNWEGESDGRLLILIEHALALYPHEPNLHILAGLIALRIGRSKRAEGAFRRSLEQITNRNRRAEVGLYLAWALDLQGQRAAAKYLYKRILRDGAGPPSTLKRAQQGRWRKFTLAHANALPIDFTAADIP
ncbi:C45 family autoproteolytic acyltransferase/hydolase [Bradymonas sediminis]|uniref:Peptidase C45 hydrolase domain-containing protein n=1 Tax=Bradymonas sediminis TaxID=1548548 RepID=A0A2Z4FJL9_9DELT|nr:C45 family autoproteolytic acyltransferase/hydolase [Bradymonas sediminis]AWV89025.1 hypothetical protein DN745_06605 [Bradymonas sediminis]TDP64516.1 acyl-CoA:6-aminopenicillanic acid acyl transferase [Bradymonas sediminis]